MGCDAVITAYNMSGDGGLAGFPSGGMPYDHFYIGTSVQNYWGTIRFPDLDGDGNADICGRGGAGIFCGI